jgi:ABC-type uncharacterized transport system ATPase subunit
MSNIRTLRDIEQQENASPLPSTWTTGQSVSESYQPSTGHYRIGFIPQVRELQPQTNLRKKLHFLTWKHCFSRFEIF